jgi:hypothetical protein
MEKFTKEKLEELMELVLNYTPRPPYIITPQWWVEEESAAHPNDFIFHDDGTITWCGYIVYTYGDRYE